MLSNGDTYTSSCFSVACKYRGNVVSSAVLALTVTTSEEVLLRKNRLSELKSMALSAYVSALNLPLVVKTFFALSASCDSFTSIDL